ncbi:MAG: hypothetical protein ACRDP3_17810 [Streptomyces sp.]|uniref:hypothetical protein n=1 Tax=Streptomyces sp. TaxID=1931 RepID=UPI003D6B8DC1
MSFFTIPVAPEAEKYLLVVTDEMHERPAIIWDRQTANSGRITKEHLMTRDELIHLVERIMAGEGTESEHGELVRQLKENVPHPRAVGLIYFSDPPLSAAQVVDEALAYRPIAM